MGHPITVGSVPGRRVGLLPFLMAAVFVLGCAKPVPPPLSPDLSQRRQLETLIRMTEAEGAALRADMAAARITAAKKESEIQELRQHIADLRHAKTGQQQVLDTKQTELITLKAEREQLVQAKSELQIQLAEVPQLRQTSAELQALNGTLQERLQHLERAVDTLAAEVARLKQEVAPSTAVVEPQPVAAPTAAPVVNTPIPVVPTPAAPGVNTPIPVAPPPVKDGRAENKPAKPGNR